jgi:hypothetical protein
VEASPSVAGALLAPLAWWYAVDAVFRMRKPPRWEGATVADVAKELGIHALVSSGG